MVCATQHRFITITTKGIGVTKYNFDPFSYAGLDKLGRIPLPANFHMREFLYSEIAVHYGKRNVPDDVDQAVHVITNLRSGPRNLAAHMPDQNSRPQS